MELSNWPLAVIVAAFAGVTGVIAWFGIRMTTTARDLARETGMGEAVMGALFIGGSTSLSGITTSVTAAANGHAELAVSNGLGGIAAQTSFLAIADIAYRRANLEHAAASAENLFMAAFLMLLLSIHLLGLAAPDLALFSVHPCTLLIIAVYVGGTAMLSKTHDMPMWLPRKTADTSAEPKTRKKRSPPRLAALWSRFATYCGIVAGAGWALAQLAVPLIDRTGLTHSIVGGVFTAVATSIPELVVAVSAVRMGALNLAVGDIIGGNAFDTLFIAASDIAYRGGSIYAAVGNAEAFWLALSLVMISVLMLGLIYRERKGPGNIGMESVFLLVTYFGGIAFLATGYF